MPKHEYLEEELSDLIYVFDADHVVTDYDPLDCHCGGQAWVEVVQYIDPMLETQMTRAFVICHDCGHGFEIS